MYYTTLFYTLCIGLFVKIVIYRPWGVALAFFQAFCTIMVFTAQKNDSFPLFFLFYVSITAAWIFPGKP